MAPFVDLRRSFSKPEAVSTVGLGRSARRARHLHLGNVGVARASALALPFRSESFSASVSFFSIKHWPNPSAGIEEMVRVTHRGGYVHLVEVNAHATRDQWRRYVDLTRVPRPLRAFYVVATHPTVVRHSLTPEALGKAFPDDAPVTDVRVDAATDLPYLVARARVTHGSDGVTST